MANTPREIKENFPEGFDIVIDATMHARGAERASTSARWREDRRYGVANEADRSA
jgi:hypothetical protein